MGHRFLQITLVAALGMVVVMLAAILTGWGLSGTGGLLIFGVLYLILAVMNLFVDFSFVDRAQAAGIDADAEWFSAFTILRVVDDGLPGPAAHLRRLALGAPHRTAPARTARAVRRRLRPPGRAG